MPCPASPPPPPRPRAGAAPIDFAWFGGLCRASRDTPPLHPEPAEMTAPTESIVDEFVFTFRH